MSLKDFLYNQIGQKLRIIVRKNNKIEIDFITKKI